MSKSVIVGTLRPYINKQFSNDRIGIKDEDPQPPILGGK